MWVRHIRFTSAESYIRHSWMPTHQSICLPDARWTRCLGPGRDPLPARSIPDPFSLRMLHAPLRTHLSRREQHTYKRSRSINKVSNSCLAVVGQQARGCHIARRLLRQATTRLLRPTAIPLRLLYPTQTARLMVARVSYLRTPTRRIP